MFGICFSELDLESIIHKVNKMLLIKCHHMIYWDLISIRRGKDKLYLLSRDNNKWLSLEEILKINLSFLI